MWKQLTITLLSISCLSLSQELKIHLTEEGTQEDNIETRLLTVRLDKEFLQPSVMERLSKTSNIIFADFPEMPEFVNAKQYEDILNSLYDEKEEQHTSEENLKDKTAYIGNQEEQENEKNILDQTEGEQNSKNKKSGENDSAQNEKDKYVEDKLPELKKEEEKEIKEKVENKEDERWVNVDEGKNINNDSSTDDNKEINQEEQTNNKEKKLVKEKEEVTEENERYEEHVKEGDRECKSKNKNIITSKIQTIKRNETENKTTTIVFTTEKRKISSSCTPTNVTLVSKTTSILRCSSTGYLKQHNGTLPNFTNVTTVVVEESKTFKISSSFTFAFIVFIISTGLVIGF
ncbi:hypothetical protein RI543_004598 [Arxiozyma heterogenica]|uniref:Uncharacterized protein n=1 Tax=Arxiozyma heterogenica TaxID=278026 RepID=A0AAN7VZ83_9SACH|nr:hypothetical protein RI543_004598 [Kazachstania heterogenica]